MTFKLALIETRRGCAMMESQPRYDVMLNGKLAGQLYFNMRGYVGSLPTRSGASLGLPEGSIASFKREVTRLNREAKEFEARLHRACANALLNLRINVLELHLVTQRGQEIIRAGADDATLALDLRTFAESISHA